MHHISQQNIDISLRRPHLSRYKKQLVEALANPALTLEWREELSFRLKNLGKPKCYRASAPTPPGAVDPGIVPAEHDSSISDLSQGHLMTLPLSRLDGFARANGIDVSTLSTKAQYVAAILNKENLG